MSNFFRFVQSNKFVKNLLDINKKSRNIGVSPISLLSVYISCINSLSVTRAMR